jgi:hydroxymethylpyrimidine pyrophosphatase-like HAD family hydrolase
VSSIELVVTDLDATLWPADNLDTPHPDTIDAWHELDRRGIPVLVATGRRLASTRDPLASFGLTPNAVVLNGALAVDLASGERYHRQHHDPHVACHALDVFRAHGLDPCIYVDEPDVDIYLTATPATTPAHVAAFGGRATIVDLDHVVAGASILSFGAFGFERALLERIVVDLDGNAEAHIVADMWTEHWGITVTPLGLSKWTGVLVACERHGIDPSRVLAIGDGVNDLELLTNASVGLAMADGDPDAIAVADHIVPPSAEGGWATVLDFV